MANADEAAIKDDQNPSGAEKRPQGPSRRRGTGSKMLRRVDETFEEWRYQPAASRGAYGGVVALSLGGVALGAGCYALLWSQTIWHDRARWLLAAGSALLALFFALGRGAAQALIVGELGVGFDEGGKPNRTAWWQIRRVRVEPGTLVLEAEPRAIMVPLASYAGAAARIVKEAASRIAKRVDIADEARAELGEPEGGARRTAETPQVTPGKCRSSGQALTFEKDVRMCGRCCALYHRESVPRRCLECGKKLKGA